MQNRFALGRCLAAVLVAACGATAMPTFAQAPGPEWPLINDLAWVDNGYLTRQRGTVDEIVRGEYGRQLRGDHSDLTLLQRIIDDELIKQVETQKLQALGVVLGDVFVKELGLKWRTYDDPEGKSRAVCLTDNRECLFPVTMIAKRVELGHKPNIIELFERGKSHMQPYLPKLPYSAR